MNKLIYISLIITILPLISLAQTAKEYYSSGLIKYKTERYQEAANDFGKAIKKDDKYIEAYIMRGSCYEKLNQPKKAVKDYSKVIKIKPDYAHAYVKRAQVYKKLKEIEKAITDFSSALKIKESGFVYIYRADCYMINKNYEKALSDYKAAEKLLPNNIKAKKEIARIYFLQKKYDDALKKLNSLLTGQPDDAGALLLRAKVYNAKGENKKCCNDLQKAYNLGSKEAGELIKEICGT